MTQANQPTTAPPPTAAALSPSPTDPAFTEAILALGGVGLLALAQAHRLRQQRMARHAREQLRRQWRFVNAQDPQGSWAKVAPQALMVMRLAQTEAARGGDQYVTAALAYQGVTADPVAVLVPAAFALSAADGRPMDTLLSYPAFEVSAFVDQGMPGPQALAIGERHLDRIVQTEVSDAARVSTGVAVASERKTMGYIRMLTPPSCSRCVLLAGRWYKWNAGFARHP